MKEVYCVFTRNGVYIHSHGTVSVFYLRDDLVLYGAVCPGVDFGFKVKGKRDDIPGRDEGMNGLDFCGTCRVFLMPCLFLSSYISRDKIFLA